MAKKIVSTSFVRLTHRMNNDEKRLFRILFERVLPKLNFKKEYTFSAEELIALWCPEATQEKLEKAFWNLGVTLTYQCTANPMRPSWGAFSLFDDWGITEDGTYRYVYNSEFKKLLTYPIVYKELLQEGLIVEIPESQPIEDSFSAFSLI
ncbi:MAG: hypothetical protein K2X90_03400 [Candidatus Babeliaceae bacterium]|nr:hypothetical protein [Candidatus Babeliaceae bacterium]